MTQKTTFLTFKHLPVFAVLLFLSLVSLKTSAQTTEAFEDETVGLKTFSDNGQAFTIIDGSGETTYDIETFAGGGWNGTSGDNNFIDNTGGSPGNNDGSSFTIKTTDGTDITIKSLYLFVSNRAVNGPASTTLTFTGKKDGTTIYTITKSSGIINGADFTPNNGFTFIDFSSEGGTDNSNNNIDELIISATGNADYLALDALTWALAPVDATAPRITSIVRQTPATSPTNADALTFRITFDENVQGVGAADFTITGASGVSIGVVGSNAIYDVTLSGGDLASVNSTITLGFAGGQNITDISGNALTNLTPTGTNNNTFVLDNQAPLISSIARQSPTTSPTNADALVWDMTFDQAVANVDAADFAVIGTTGTITSVTNPSGNVYRVTASGGDLAGLNATVTLGFAGGQNIADASGNTLTNLTPTGTNNNTFVVNNTAPRINSIARQSPTTSPTNADALVWDVTFDQAVANVDAADFAVIGTTGTIASVTNPSGNVYRVTASGGDLAGLNATVTLGFAGGQNIADASGNALTNLTPTGTNNNTFVIDNTQPLINSIARQSPTTSPTNADALVWDVTFNGAVANVDASDFTVSGTTGTIASVTNPSGNVYRVTASGGDLAGLNATVTLGFAGGQNIADASGNALTNLTPTGTNNNTFVVDNTPPVYTWTGTTNNDWGTTSNWDLNSVPTATADVVIPSGLMMYPTASSAVTFNSLTINSGASFIPNSTTTGAVTYKRNLPTTGDWYLVSSPIANETLQNVIANNTFATGTAPGNIGIGLYENSNASQWAYVNASSTGNIIPGIGISVQLATAGDISSTGTALNTSNVIFGVSTGTVTNFNLLGNPFTAFINSATFATTNTGVLTEETIWLWNGTAYVTYNNASPIEVAPGQAFFIEASTNGAITFATANRSHQNTDTFMREAPKSTFELSVEEGTNKSATKVFYADNKTTGFDNGYDSKMFGGTDYKFKVYTELVSDSKGKKLAIQTLPNQNLETMVIPVGLIAEAGKKITFSVKAQNLPDNTNVFLEDKFNNTLVNISKENHSVTLKSDSKGTGQFYIHTSAKNLEDIDITKDLQNVSIYKSANNSLTVAGLQTDKASVNVYSILGKKVISTELKSTGVHVIQLPKTAAGVYIVELNSSLGKISKKIILE
ncbi:T9SS type A sorting domain-containing protein [Tenacibaculum ovolyticum]|uniref:T9SS type A sorting domain-containing protein n=1 Tax=Tenacibaculum ovolyticum TaxID=104270 RepID=UPI00040A198F|nr:T9SS type A sorting domain-containing protein [Tenacibaculum ovolyticum]